MKFNTLTEAIAEATRFIRAAEKVRDQNFLLNTVGSQYVQAGSNRDTAAARRASMDLTRKLADLRQGR